MSTSSATALTRAPKRLKDIKTEPVILPSTVEILDTKKEELAQLTGDHKAALAAELADYRQWHNDPGRQNPSLKRAKEELAARIERLQGEIVLLQVQVRAERAKTHEAKTEWEDAQRQRALALIALRKCNAAIWTLRKQGISGPCDLGFMPGQPAPWEFLLLGCKEHAGLGGQAARGYLSEAFNAGLISKAELAEDA
jgi:hypothetical protein